MHSLTNEIPEGLNVDEEKWLKFFSKNALLATIVAFMVAFLIFKFCSLYGLQVFGIILGGILMFGTYFLFSFHLPSDMTIKGAGLTLIVVMIRIQIRRKNKVLYVKNYRPYEEEL